MPLMALALPLNSEGRGIAFLLKLSLAHALDRLAPTTLKLSLSGIN